VTDYDDDHGTAVTRYQSAPVPAQTPTPSMPSLPSSSGAWLGTRNTILRKDTAFVELHAAYLNARRAQSDAMTGLVESRIKAALTMAKLTALPEIAEHEYRLGRLDRAHEMRIRSLSAERKESDAEAALLEAKQRVASLIPEPPKPPAPPPAAPTPAAKGLTPLEVKMVAQRLPEIKRETIETLCMMLSGLLAEKNT